MTTLEARQEIRSQTSKLPKLPADQLVDKALRLESSAVDIRGAVFAGAYWRKVLDTVRDDRAITLASARLRKMENLVVCLAVKETMEANGETFSSDLLLEAYRNDR